MQQPKNLYIELLAQWEWALRTDELYFDDGTKDQIRDELRNLKNCIRVLDHYMQDGKPHLPGEWAALKWGEGYENILEVFENLRNYNLSAKHQAEHADRVGAMEEVNLLTVLTESCAEAIRHKYEHIHLAKTLPQRREIMIQNDHPDFPIYPEGSMSREDLATVYNMRDALQLIRRADVVMAAMDENEPTPAKELIKKIPPIMSFIGTDETQSREKILETLQTKYNEAYNLALGALAHHMDMDDAERAMARETMAIEDFIKLPSRTVARP